MNKLLLLFTRQSGLAFYFILFTFQFASAQNVGIGTQTPDASAQLDVSSTSKGFLPPRMTYAQRNSIETPSTGLMVWCLDCGSAGELQVYNGTTWKSMSLTNASAPPTAAGSSIVISQVYGGGSNSGATYNADYVELFNKSTTTQSLSGLSIQYASATGTSWSLGVLNAVSIPPGGYYLIQLGSAGTIGLSLPTPDATFTTIAIAADKGKIALVNSTTGLNVACPTTNILDFVGYGTANCYEGTASTAAPSTITAVFRNNNGCSDTNDNLADFTLALPAPRNSSTAASICQ
jgi:hypothetical protein